MSLLPVRACLWRKEWKGLFMSDEKWREENKENWGKDNLREFPNSDESYQSSDQWTVPEQKNWKQTYL